jgi:hypothetical protein
MVLASACNARLGPDRVDANWVTYENARLTLFVRPGSVAETQQATLLDVLADQYAYTLAALNVNYGGRISVFLYNSAGDATLESNYSGVAYPNTEAVRAVVVAPVDGNTYSLIAHEINHVIQQNTLGRPGTSFMNEGLPSAVMSTRFHDYGREFYWKWTAAHSSSLPSLTALVDDANWNGSDTQYKTSASFLAYLIDRYGPALIAQVYQVPSSRIADSIRTVYGRSLQDLETDWRAFCASR